MNTSPWPGAAEHRAGAVILRRCRRDKVSRDCVDERLPVHAAGGVAAAKIALRASATAPTLPTWEIVIADH